MRTNEHPGCRTIDGFLTGPVTLALLEELGEQLPARPGGAMRRLTVRLDPFRPDAILVTLSTSRPYQPNTRGGQHRASLRVWIDGDVLIVSPHTPVLKPLGTRTRCLGEPDFDPAAWVAGITRAARQILEQRLRGS